MSNKKFILGLLSILVFSTVFFLYFRKKNSSPFSKMEFPKDNLQTDAKVELGKLLFFDPRLSSTGKIACSSCHVPELAFTDGEDKSIGVNGNNSMRNAPTLFNVGFAPTFMADAHIHSLEMQAIVPIQDSNEMGMRMGELIELLQSDEDYQFRARAIFNRDFDAFVLTRSLSAYQRTLISDHSPFDRYYSYKDEQAISQSAQNGWKLFSGKLNCIACHPYPFFTTFKAENNGLTANYKGDFGRFRVTKYSTDMGRFKTPTLRNIALTSPYLHDGSVKTLEEIIELYSKSGVNHTNRSELLFAFHLTSTEKKELIEFLRSLTEIKE